MYVFTRTNSSSTSGEDHQCHKIKWFAAVVFECAPRWEDLYIQQVARTYVCGSKPHVIFSCVCSAVRRIGLGCIGLVCGAFYRGCSEPSHTRKGCTVERALSLRPQIAIHFLLIYITIPILPRHFYSIVCQKYRRYE